MSSVTVSTNSVNVELSEPERCILLAIDASQRSRDAFGWTLSNVYRTGDKLVFVNVTTPSATNPDVSATNNYLHQEAMGTLSAYVKAFGQHCIANNIPFESLHCEGHNKAAMVAQVAQQCGASLLVVGNHNKDLSERLFLGSVSESLVHNTVLPVAIVKQPHLEPRMSNGGQQRRRIGVAVDDSDHARFAFDYTLANFSRDGDAIYVIAVRPAAKHQREIAAEVTAPVGLAGLVSGEQLMETYAAAVRDSGVQSSRIHLVHTLTHDRPAEAFAHLASDLSLDLVVVGSRGRGVVARNMLGSFCDEVIRTMRTTNVVVAKMPPHKG